MAVASRATPALLCLLVGVGCALRPPRSHAPGPEATVVEHVSVREFENDNCGPGSLAIVLNALGDEVSEAELRATLPRAPGGGVLSVDLLLAARRRGFSASLVSGDEVMVRNEIGDGRPVILLLRLLNAPGRSGDVYHYVVVDGVDPGNGLLRFQFGDGRARWTTLEPLEKAWEAAGHALLIVRPRSDGGRLSEAVELERAGELDAAAERYLSVLEDHPDSVRAWVDLGNVRARQGRRTEAERAYRRGLEIAPDDTDALNNLAWLFFEGGADLAAAESYARAAASRPGPDHPLVLDTLARILAARGRCDEADAILGEALGWPDLSPALRAEIETARRDSRRTCRPAP